MLHKGMTMMTINANASEMVTGRSASTRLHLTRLGNCGARAVAAVVGLLAVTELAWAADLSPPPVAAPAPYNWSGLYIGLNAGYASAKVTETVSGGGGTASANLPGGIGGLQIGANVPNRRHRVGL